MKLLFLTLLTAFSFNSFSECLNKLPQSEVTKALNLEPNAGSISCAQRPNEECICYDGIDWTTANLQDEYVNGTPNYSDKINETECASIESCELLRPTLCEAPYEFFYAENLIFSGYEAYCSRIVSYEQVATGRKILVEDPVKKAAKDIRVDSENAAKQAMAFAIRSMECGKSAQAFVLVRNAPKGLTTEQVKTLVATYSPVKALLDSGSLVSALEEIAEIPADGVVITEADKVALIAHINGCKP